MSAMGEQVERRSSPRVIVDGQGRFRKIPIGSKEHRLRTVEILDISQGGLRLRSDELLQVKTNLLLELHLPDLPTIRSLATVAWVKPILEGDSYEVGGMFVEPTREARARIEWLVQTH